MPVSQNSNIASIILKNGAPDFRGGVYPPETGGANALFITTLLYISETFLYWKHSYVGDIP